MPPCAANGSRNFRPECPVTHLERGLAKGVAPEPDKSGRRQSNTVPRQGVPRGTDGPCPDIAVRKLAMGRLLWLSFVFDFLGAQFGLLCSFVGCFFRLVFYSVPRFLSSLLRRSPRVLGSVIRGLLCAF